MVEAVDKEEYRDRLAYLQHGLENHGVALHNLPQGDELGVGAQEIQGACRTACSPSASWSLLHAHRIFINYLHLLTYPDNVKRVDI